MYGQHEGDLHAEPPPPRRPRRAQQIPPDESPTELIHFDDEPYDNQYDDLYDEEIQGGRRPEDGADVEEPYSAEYEDDEYDYYDEDDEEGRAEPEYIEDERPTRRERRRAGRRRGRAFGWVAAIAVIALLAGGAWFGITEIFGYEDFEGAGESDVLVQVADGDSTNTIATKLASSGVVASPKAFVKASDDNTKVRGVRPGFYVMKTKMSGASAVDKMVDPVSRVGDFQLRPGTQLDDINQPDGKVTDGVFALLSKASCAELNGKSTCVPVEELRRVAETADLVALGVPSWAAESVGAVEPKRRLEGLIAPGVYDVKPGSDATGLLTEVLRTSATRLETAGLPSAASGLGLSPYQTLVVASLIEREAVQQDFAKVSRVIYNRLAKNMRLELDSTVNYLLDKPVVTTTDDDRNRPGPYNTYKNTGLPPSPISAPSEKAIIAAEKPVEGSIVFFVKCEKNGISCFADTLEQHNQNKRDAKARGAY